MLPPSLRRLLRRLAAAAGIAAVIALVVRLLQHLKPLLKAPQPADGAQTPDIKKAEDGKRPLKRGNSIRLSREQASEKALAGSKPYAAFVSHMKIETSMESRFIQTELEAALGRPCFLDSDDLRDLSDLEKHVRDSDVLVLVQSQSVLTRPYCLLEILTAMDAGVPIVGVALCRHAFPYSFEDASLLLESLDTSLGEVSPGADVFLKERGIDLAEAAFKCSSRIPKIISVHLDTCASRNILAATIDDLTSALASARPVPLDGSKAEWLAAREQRRTRRSPGAGGAHGAPFLKAPSAAQGKASAISDALAAVKSGGKRVVQAPPLPPPKPTLVIRQRSDLPAFDDDSVITMINGAHRLGPDCPLEGCCSFSVPVIMLLREMGAKLHEYSIDLADKPEWLREIVGITDSDAKLTTPMLHYRGQWMLDSGDMMKALPTFFPEPAAKLYRPPPHLLPGSLDGLGMQAVMPLFQSQWERAEDHPLLRTWGPFEAALGRTACLGGETICDADVRAAAWMHALIYWDGLLSPVPLDWADALPNLTRWFEGRMLERVRQATTTERRFQLLLADFLGKEYPSLASRFPPAVMEEIDEIRERAKVAAAGLAIAM